MCVNGCLFSRFEEQKRTEKIGTNKPQKKNEKEKKRRNKRNNKHNEIFFCLFLTTHTHKHTLREQKKKISFLIF
jgi:hypothetical protein